MEFEKLGNIATVKTGKYDVNHSTPDGAYVFYTCAFGQFKSPTYSFEGPAIILPGNGANVGEVFFYNGKFEAYQRTYVVQNFKADPNYIYAYFKSQWKNSLRNKQFGSATNYIRLNNLTDFTIPLPPLPDQLHIATILSKAENLIAQRKESIRLLDEFLKSTFLEMFGDPVRNEKGWETKPLGELCNIRRGASPRPINNFIGDEVPWIKIGDGTKGNDLYIESTQVSITKEGATKSVLLDEGSLVFANCGVSLGFARILKIKGCIHDGWLSFENIRSELDKIYLLKLLNNSTDYLRRIAPDGTQPNLNTGIMKNFKIILPPINLQTQFSQIVEKTEALKTQYQQSLQELENLYGSLSQKAFRGELTSKQNSANP